MTTEQGRMSRIQKALRKSRIDNGKGKGKGKTKARGDHLDATDQYIAINPDAINFAELPTLKPDDDLLEANHVVSVQPDAPARSIYKILRTRILQRLRSSHWNILGVTGSGPGEGKTLTAINLAYSLSHDVNYRVILVDLDLRRPSVHTALGIEPTKDLNSYIEGKASLKDVLVRPGEERLAVLTNQTTHRDSSEVLSAPVIVDLVNEFRSLGPNTIVVIDLPPVLAGDDVLALSPLMDAILLVVAEGSCKREYLAGMQELLNESDVIGAVLNRSREKSSSMEYYGYY